MDINFEIIQNAQPTVETPLQSPKFPRVKLKSWKTLSTLTVLLILAVSSFFLINGQKKTQEVRTRATTSDVILSFGSTKTSLNVGETLPVTVQINTNTKTVSAVDLAISYSTDTLQVVSLQNGTFLGMVLRPPTIQNGLASITLGATCVASGCSPKQGVGALALLQIKALKASDTPINIAFNSATQVAALGETTNVVGTLTPISLTITTLPGITPTNTLMPTPTPTTPTPTPTIPPGPTATPTPTATPGAIPGDFNNDGKVNLLDYVLFMNYWFFKSPEGDLNGDGKVNVIDYTIFMNYWYSYNQAHTTPTP